MYKYFLFLIVTVFLFSCHQNGESKKNNLVSDSTIESKSDINDCVELSFQKKYADSVIVKSKYFKCEPLWKTNLQFYINNELLYTTSDSLEYQFNNYSFPTIIKVDSSLFILVERDDRPLLNKVDVFKFKNNKLDTIFSIPLFKQNGKDIDNDGNIEYCGYLDFMEGISEEKTAYNPIFAYELDNGVKFDSSATIKLNKKVYGSFYGFKQDYSILIDKNEKHNNWP